jgi:hypothetical protein
VAAGIARLPEPGRLPGEEEDDEKEEEEEEEKEEGKEKAEGEGASAGLGRAAFPRLPRGGARWRAVACRALCLPARLSLFPPSGQRGANEEVLFGSVPARAAPCPPLPAGGGAGVPPPQFQSPHSELLGSCS